MWKKMKPQVSVIKVRAAILLFLCSLPLVDKKGEDYENRVEKKTTSDDHSIKGQKAMLKERFELQYIKNWDGLSLSRNLPKRHFSQQKNTVINIGKKPYLYAIAYTIE